MSLDFQQVQQIIEDIYHEVLPNDGGNVADYIPQLGKVNPSLFGISIATVDGQKFSIGDTAIDFCFQSCSKPLNYCMARKLNGYQKVHQHVGHEPSGQRFNAFILNDEGLPHNPMINAGAIMTCSLIEPDREPADRFDTIMESYQMLAGGNGRFGFDNSVYLSEKEHADRNNALAYFMREHDSLPDGCNIQKTLEFYFQICSITTNCETVASIASTLANRGVCPVTQERVFDSTIVRDCLSLMYTCGMYDYSGRFAFEIGLPAKSGVSGCLFVVVPNVMGICIWSPRLDELGNSVRGVEVCRKIGQHFGFHIFGNLVTGGVEYSKCDARDLDENIINQLFINAASQGNVEKVQELVGAGKVDPNSGDYDGRTALHLAVAEGHVAMVECLLNMGADAMRQDRWGTTALHEATLKQTSEHIRIIEILEARGIVRPEDSASVGSDIDVDVEAVAEE